MRPVLITSNVVLLGRGWQGSEKRLREENMSLRKEARHKDTLLDNLANRDRAFGAHKDAVRVNEGC